jgi:hypothetical protein
MELLICHSDGTHFVTSSGIRPKFTAINQQDAVPPESGQLPAKAFENRTVFLTGQGTPTDGGWIYSTRVISVLESPLDSIKKGISTGNA